MMTNVIKRRGLLLLYDLYYGHPRNIRSMKQASVGIRVHLVDVDCDLKSVFRTIVTAADQIHEPARAEGLLVDLQSFIPAKNGSLAQMTFHSSDGTQILTPVKVGMADMSFVHAFDYNAGFYKSHRVWLPHDTRTSTIHDLIVATVDKVRNGNRSK